MTNLRFFEQTGLISPERSENGYRSYSINDAYRINTFNSLTRMGYSLSQAAERTECIEADRFAAEMDENIQRMEQEKQLLERRIEWAKTLREVYSSAEYYLNHPIEKHLPEHSFLHCVNGEDPSPSFAIGDAIARMVDILPFSSYAGLLEADGNVFLGMLAPTEKLHDFGIDTSCMQTIPEGDYVIILSDAANRYSDITEIPCLKDYFPNGFPDKIYVVYTMAETPESFGRGFALIRKK